MMHAFSLRPFLGSLLGTGALALSLLLGSCSDKPQETVNQGELAARTAKIYYDSLAAGRFDSFYEGKLKADTVPETYRQQMKAILKQFADKEQKRHKGIDSVRISMLRRRRRPTSFSRSSMATRHRSRWSCRW